jgi:hypothetical protein
MINIVELMRIKTVSVMHNCLLHGRYGVNYRAITKKLLHDYVFLEHDRDAENAYLDC